MRTVFIATVISLFLISLAVSAEQQSDAKTGFIEGTLIYPSDGVPSDIKIYAENISTGLTYSTSLSALNNPNIFTDKTKYKLKVPAGSYYVYSMTNHVKGKEDYRAYYSEFVACGLKAQCPSHEPIKVSVKTDKVTSNIDPVDWYIRLRAEH